MTAHGDGVDTSQERVHETGNREHVGMEHAIEQAAKALWGATCSDGMRAAMRPDCWAMARALADADLLAPAPLREDMTTEWGVAARDDETLDPWWMGHDPTDEAQAREVATRHRDSLVRRRVTPWTDADAADRDR